MKKESTTTSNPRSTECECNYTNNYYGDQVCRTIIRATV